jgi:hypothetical protein
MTEEERNERRVRRAAARVRAYKEVFSTELGKKVLHDLMRVHGVMRAHPADPQAMALKEGERLVVLRILKLMETDPSQFLERIEDAQVDE